jgi:hypothetical protein
MKPNLENYSSPSGIPTMWGALSINFVVDRIGTNYACMQLKFDHPTTYKHIGTMWEGEFVMNNGIYKIS